MRRPSFVVVVGGALALLGGCAGPEPEPVEAAPDVEVTRQHQALSSLSPEARLNVRGIADTIHVSGSVDRTNPFFDTSLSTNGRSCESCHNGATGWTLSPTSAALEFLLTAGKGPLFRLHDAGSRPDADLTTLGDRVEAFKDTLVKKGLIRFTRTHPVNAEFTILAVDDPSGWSTPQTFSNFRRPTPTVNATHESTATSTGGPHVMFDFLLSISGGAARFHGALPDLPPQEDMEAMRDLQFGLISAQAWDFKAGDLDAAGARGGPQHLAQQPFYLGINDIQGNDPQGHPFTRTVFTIFDAWKDADKKPGSGPVGKARAQIWRGQEIFNHFEFEIRGVNGLNDVLGQQVVVGTCSTCHNAPNVGGHSVARWMDIGTANEFLRAPEITLLTVQNNATGEIRKVSDIGRAQVSGAWKDIGAFRVPPLRSLAARAPYFHDGQAKDLKAVIEFYDRRFNMNLTKSEKEDLEAFLGAL